EGKQAIDPTQGCDDYRASGTGVGTLPPERSWQTLEVAVEPEVRYTKSGDVSIAYSLVGDGPFDVVFVSGWVLSNFGTAWDGPPADFYRGIASFARLILFDKR